MIAFFGNLLEDKALEPFDFAIAIRVKRRKVNKMSCNECIILHCSIEVGKGVFILKTYFLRTQIASEVHIARTIIGLVEGD